MLSFSRPNHMATAMVALLLVAAAGMPSSALARDAGAVGDAAGTAAGTVGDAAGAAAGAASAAGDAASGAIGTAGDAVGGAGRGLGNVAAGFGSSGAFGARAVFGPPADPFTYNPKAPQKPKKAKKKKKPTEEPHEDVAEQGGGDTNGAVGVRLSCSDILSDPAGYDRALVQLCRRAGR
jgi:hypothetical protein